MPKEKEGSEKKTSRTTRAVKDKWRSKGWYKVRAPVLFQGVELGETPADEPEDVIGRILEVAMNEVTGTGDPSISHIKLKFRVSSVGEDKIALTRFVGHELTSDYIRRLARRKRSKIDTSFKVTTKDGVVMTIKHVAVSEHRLQTRLRALLRLRLKALTEEEAAKRTGAEMVRDMLNGELAKAITNGLRQLYPLKKIDIRASVVEGEIPEAPPPVAVEEPVPPPEQPSPAPPAPAPSPEPTAS
jgi:small subunit ribosomal protein S3Ae